MVLSPKRESVSFACFLQTIFSVASRFIFLFPLIFFLQECFLLQRFMRNPSGAGGDEIIRKLRGHFSFLSQESYSNFFVQECFAFGHITWCHLVAQELDGGDMMMLVTHMYGNYVVQKLIKRFFRERCQLPPSLFSILQSNRASLENDTWGSQVLITYDKNRK